MMGGLEVEGSMTRGLGMGESMRGQSMRGESMMGGLGVEESMTG